MKRNFNGLADTEFDLLIIGGGITGSCIARDAASRGLKVALVEKNDFSSATSAGSSKLVHGGLRYLRNFELGLVRESLAERRIWERIAPHQVRPLAFLLPADKKSKSTLNIGLTLYDLLSFDRNKVKDPEQRLPGHKYGKHILGAEVFDRVTGNETNVRARITLNAAGPWADSLLGLAQQGEPSRHLLRSKGIHLITRQLTSGHAVMAAIPEEMGGGHMFLLPWRGKTIIGTTDTAYEGDPDELEVTPREITAYLSVINKTISGIGLTRDDVIHAYAGLRPLIQDRAEKKNPYNASRRSEVVDHQKEDGLKGLFSAIGGKWTTSRHVAEDAVTAIAKRLKRKLPASRTAETPLPGGKFDALSPFFDAMNQRYPELSGARLDELVFTYGSEMDAIATLASESAALAERLAPDRGEIGAQVVHAVREEMAFTLEDVVFRRTGLGTLGYPGDEALARVTQIMARELSWDAAQIEEELRGVKRLFYAERT
jgi:glycerol-3-phosphate dehydrogenase